MASTLVHVAFAGLLGAALLADEFDTRAILVVMVAAVLPDLDTFLGLWIPGTHRAALHTLLFPAVLGLLVYYDVRVRSRSTIVARWGASGVRVAWVSLVALTVAGIGLDLFVNGVNLFYPLHDRFYDLSGRVFLSNQRGFVQTVVDLQTSEGTTGNTHYSTGVDPTRGSEPENVERIFPIAWTGVRLLILLTGVAVVTFRIWESRKR